MLLKQVKPYRHLGYALVVSSFVSVWFTLLRVITTGSTFFTFMVWNLVLAWLPLVWGTLFVRRLHKTRWTDTGTLLLLLLWLTFLPNSFYILTDFIHLQIVDPSRVLLDVVLLASFAWNGLVLGYLSLWLVHHQLLKKLSATYAHLFIAGVLLLSSFAIYLGRYLRWNTWDLIISPAALLFDLSERLINPLRHIETFTTTAVFFVLLGAMYLVIWHLVLAVLGKQGSK